MEHLGPGVGTGLMQRESFRGGSRALRVELVGLAGAGKTTLKKNLIGSRPNIQVGIRVPRVLVYPHLLNRSLGLVPCFLRRFSDSRWFNRKETSALTYLDAWRWALGWGAGKRREAILFDHGPLFWLTRIRAMGPSFVRSPRAERWWRDEVTRWGRLVDVLVWLDAPDDVLMHRIRERAQDHLVKHESDDTILQFLSGFRTAFDETMEIVSLGRGARRYDFHTAENPPLKLAEDVLSIMDRHREAL